MVDQTDGVYAHYPTSRTPGVTQRPWELTSQTLSQYRIEDELREPHWEPPVPGQNHDPLAGAYTPGMETVRMPNSKTLNASFNGGMRSGRGDPMPHTTEDIQYMTPPKFGWRQEELGIDDIMRGIFTKLDDPVNVGYLDDWSGQQGSYGGQGDQPNNSLSVPQGL
jgi:hypothetical protein